MTAASALTGPAVAAALLLVGAGVAKALRPTDTAKALTLAGLPVGPGGVRAGALAETAIGVWAVVAGGLLSYGAVAASYLGFAGYLTWLLRRGLPVASCGCFGTPDVPATRLHVGVDLVAAVLAGGAATLRAPTMAVVLGDQPLGGLPFLGLVVLAATLAMAVLTLLPRLATVARRIA